MTGENLIRYIKTNHLELYDIVIGCEGYTNKAEIVREQNGIIFIADECYYNDKLVNL